MVYGLAKYFGVDIDYFRVDEETNKEANKRRALSTLDAAHSLNAAL